MILDLSGLLSSLLEASSEMNATELLTHSIIKFMDHLGYVDDHVSLCGFFSFLAILICAA
jgi:sulfur transfer protein SufE